MPETCTNKTMTAARRTRWASVLLENERVRAAREALGASRTDIARAAQCSEYTIRDVEQRPRPITVAVAVMLARALATPLGDLLAEHSGCIPCAACAGRGIVAAPQDGGGE